MRTAMRLIAALLLMLPLATCGDDGPGSGVVTISEPQDGITVRLDPGDRLDVTLHGSPSTGYNWTTLEIDNAVLRQVGAASFGGDTGLLGADGPVTLSYECVAPGVTLLELGYLRPFEDAPPLDRFMVTVIAR